MSSAIKSISSIPEGQLAGQRVLVRVDLNVPFQNGQISDDSRICAVLPTLKFLRENDAKIILMSHLGQPKTPSPEFSLRPVAERLSTLMGVAVQFVTDCVGPVAEAAVQAMASKDIILLENVRFHAEETQNDPEFAKKMSQLGICLFKTHLVLRIAPMHQRRESRRIYLPTPDF